MTANNQPQQDALTAIRAQKEEVCRRIRKSSADIRTMTHALFTPPKATNKMEQVMNLFNQGLAIYDGVMLGLRVMRNIRRVFGSR